MQVVGMPSSGNRWQLMSSIGFPGSGVPGDGSHEILTTGTQTVFFSNNSTVRHLVLEATLLLY